LSSHQTTRRRRTPRRFTLVVSDRKTGVYRRFTVNPRPVFVGVMVAFLLPVLIGLGLRWSAVSDISRLQTTADVLEVENRSYRAATGALTAQIQALQAAVAQLGDKASIDPATAKAIERLPAMVKAQAAGGPAVSAQSSRSLFVPALSSPDDTFGAPRD